MSWGVREQNHTTEFYTGLTSEKFHETARPFLSIWGLRITSFPPWKRIRVGNCLVRGEVLTLYLWKRTNCLNTRSWSHPPEQKKSIYNATDHRQPEKTHQLSLPSFPVKLSSFFKSFPSKIFPTVKCLPGADIWIAAYIHLSKVQPSAVISGGMQQWLICRQKCFQTRCRN